MNIQKTFSSNAYLNHIVTWEQYRSDEGEMSCLNP